MDPDQALTDILDAMVDGDVEQAIESAENLNGWIGRGGFQPDYRKGFWEALTRFLEAHPHPDDEDVIETVDAIFAGDWDDADVAECFPNGSKENPDE